VGAGDAFDAGFICGYLEGELQQGMDYAMALSAAKMTIPGDVALFSREEVEEIIARQGGDIRR
jgi:2-dehydro-3-deoxygluconokinase